MSDYDFAMKSAKMWEERALESISDDLFDSAPVEFSSRIVELAEVARDKALTYAGLATMFYAKASALSNGEASWTPTA